ncbi:hypothetical protein HQN90_21070 [Paenibacillus alba]|uniref:hypothetical protein n=1 Tax=Paenibacillus alba TaxID=1197127 RepID=UPI0015635B2D|nr:hypothetical protein [Paenibacillus alba]NQX68622.1 hypothetical protein [Paenibacillus alba]
MYAAFFFYYLWKFALSQPKRQSRPAKQAGSRQRQAEPAEKAVSAGEKHPAGAEPAKKAVSTREAGWIEVKAS